MGDFTYLTVLCLLYTILCFIKWKTFKEVANHVVIWTECGLYCWTMRGLPWQRLGTGTGASYTQCHVYSCIPMTFQLLAFEMCTGNKADCPSPWFSPQPMFNELQNLFSAQCCPTGCVVDNYIQKIFASLYWEMLNSDSQSCHLYFTKRQPARMLWQHDESVGK